MSDRESLAALLRERSISFGDFRLTSGQRSHYYIDARKTTMSAPGQVLIGRLGLDAIREVGWAPAGVGGLTLGADPVAYAIAAAAHRGGVAIDAFTVRKQPKEHGTARRVEGCFAAGGAVVVIEDVITTGQSALEAIHVIEAEGGRVLGVLAVVDRQEGGRAALERAGYAVEALVSAGDLGLAADAG